MTNEAKSQVQRNREWREKNPDAYREYQKVYMREYRQGLRRRKENDSEKK